MGEEVKPTHGGSIQATAEVTAGPVGITQQVHPRGWERGASLELLWFSLKTEKGQGGFLGRESHAKVQRWLAVAAVVWGNRRNPHVRGLEVR